MKRLMKKAENDRYWQAGATKQEMESFIWSVPPDVRDAVENVYNSKSHPGATLNEVLNTFLQQGNLDETYKQEVTRFLEKLRARNFEYPQGYIDDGTSIG